MAKREITRNDLIDEINKLVQTEGITTVEQFCYDHRYSRTTGNRILHSQDWERITIGKQFFYIKRDNNE